MDDKVIYTDDGLEIPWLEKSVNNFLDKTTLIFGGSNSGKSTIIEEILHICKNDIPNYIVIAPKTSDSIYRQKLPAKCIKDDLTKKRLEMIWNRQFHMTQAYNIANDINVLESLFFRTPDKKSIIMMQAIKQRASLCIEQIEKNATLNFAQKKTQKTTIETLMNEKIKKLYKDTIRQYKDQIKTQNLEEKEKVALEYLDTNPRLMIVIDDCSEKFQGWMKLFKKNETNPFESIFYKGRHNFITLVFASHDDKLIGTELRKNARITIYTSSQALVASLNKAGSGFTTQEKKTAMKMAGKIFTSEDDKIKSHQKFCYIREDAHPFKYTIANLYPDFRLGCEALYNAVAKMPNASDNLQDNPFISDIIGKKKTRKSKFD